MKEAERETKKQDESALLEKFKKLEARKKDGRRTKEITNSKKDKRVVTNLKHQT